ncbi:MAG: GAF domain-containing protein [Caldilineaceae bacterium]
MQQLSQDVLSAGVDPLIICAKIPALLLVINHTDEVVAVSDFWLDAFDYTRAEVVGRPAHSFLPTCFPSLLQLVQTPAFLAGEPPEEAECQFVKKSGEIVDVVLAATPDRDATGAVVHTIIALRDITRRKRVEQLLHEVSKGTAAVTGDAFFRALVTHLAHALHAPYVFVTECTDFTVPRVRTLASLEHNVLVESAEWNVNGTTCEMVFQGSVTYYPEQLGLLYPEYLNKRQSYLGVPLPDSQGQIVGHLAVFDTQPTRYDPQEVAVIEIFAARAGIEVERRQIERAREQSQAELRQRNLQLTDSNRHLEALVQERTQEIERRRHVAESLHEMVMLLNAAHPLSAMLDYIVSTAVQLLGATSGALYSLDSQTQMLRVQATHGLPAAYADQLQFAVERSFLGQALLHRQPVVIANLAAAISATPIDLDPPRRAFLAEHYQTLLAAPLLRQGLSGRADEVYGGLALYYAEEQQFTAEAIALVVAFSTQAALAIENARLYQQVEQMAVTAERERLARELHDSVTQLLYSLTLLAEGWRRLARTGQLTEIEEPLAELGQLGQQALKEMRLLVYELRPPSLEKEGLLGALHQRLSAVEQRSGVTTRLIADTVIELPPPLEECLYRITYEALNNALKHAAATEVKVYLSRKNGTVTLEIVDNGCGFQAQPTQGGLGLVSMRERALQQGGELQIISAPGSGTRIMATLPVWA